MAMTLTTTIVVENEKKRGKKEIRWTRKNTKEEKKEKEIPKWDPFQSV